MLGIIQFIIAGGRLAGLTFPQWITLVEAIAAAEPKIVAALQPIIALLAPEIGAALKAIQNHLATGASPHEVATQAFAGFDSQQALNTWMDQFGAGTQS